MGALLVGFDYATSDGFARLLGESPMSADLIAEFAARTTPPALARLVTAAWRAALTEAAGGTPLAEIRAAFAALQLAPQAPAAT